MEYKWQLKKGGKKQTCPACGRKRFVPYVLAADNTTPAGAEFGRCDREDNCGYHKHPTRDIIAPDVTPVAAPPVVPIRFINAVVKPHANTLFVYVNRLIGSAAAVDVWHKYKVCTTRDGRCLFWQIDINGNVRAGKAISYRDNGHRNKDVMPPVAWAHKLPEFDGLYFGNTLEQCFFGEHLLAGNGKPVIIVESEKTAVVMSARFSEYIWLACGGSQNLKNPLKNGVLAGRKVLLIPDNGQFKNWYEIALKNRWSISDIMEVNPVFEGADILDKFETHEQINL